MTSPIADLPPAAVLAGALAATDASGGVLPDDLLGTELTDADAGAVQLQVMMARAAAGDAIAGWKAGFTSGSGRDAFGVGVRPFGLIRRSRVEATGATIALGDIPGPGIELEVGVRIGRALGGGDVTAEEARDAIDGAAACFEILHTRVAAGASRGVQLAEGLRQWGVVVGDMTTAPASLDGLRGVLLRDGEPVGTAGPAFPIDDPADTLVALCRQLAPFGLGLLPGQIVITGAWVKLDVTGPGAWRGSFDGLGEVSAVFA